MKVWTSAEVCLMNEARVINFALIGLFLVTFCFYLFLVQFTNQIVGIETVTTSVSAFCG